MPRRGGAAAAALAIAAAAGATAMGAGEPSCGSATEEAELALVQLSRGRRLARGATEAEVSFCRRAAPSMKGIKINAAMGLANLSRTVPGDLAEAGVASGGGSLPLLFFLACTGDLEGRLFHLFDSWEGLPAATETADVGFQAGAFHAGYGEFLRSAETFREKYNRRVFPPDGRRPSPRALPWDDVWEKHVRIHKGLFADTMPQALAGRTLALLLCDGDMYASSRDCLSFGGDKVVPGGWIYHDDYYTFLGNFLAVREWRAARARGRKGPISLVPRSASIAQTFQEENGSSKCVPPKDNTQASGACDGEEVEAGFWQV